MRLSGYGLQIQILSAAGLQIRLSEIIIKQRMAVNI